MGRWLAQVVKQQRRRDVYHRYAVNNLLHGTKQRVDSNFFPLRLLSIIGIDAWYEGLLIFPRPDAH
jgi:hypothetical protein